MNSVRKALFICFLLLAIGTLSFFQKNAAPSLGPGVVLAQAKNCPDVVKAALATTDKKCGSTGRNKACYGNIALNAEAQPGTSNFTFTKPGDITNINSIRTIQLSPLDTKDNTWGIVVLRIQANLPDTVAGQNVTLLMFGDVGITGQATGAALVPPGATASATGAATGAATVAATPAATASALSPTAMVATAIASGKGGVSLGKPMQAFYFRTGVGDPECVEAPRDGILVQSPQGSKQKIDLTADGAKLELGSTAFLEAQAGNEMKISTLEGSVAVTSFGQTETATAGFRVRVPLDASLNASGTPTPPEPFDYATMLALPINSLPFKFTVPVPKPPANALSSTWNAAVTTSNMSAPCQGSSATEKLTVQTDPSGKTMWITGSFGDSGVYTSTGSNTFSGAAASSSTTAHETVTFTSPTHAEIQGSFTGVCTGSIHVSMDKSP